MFLSETASPLTSNLTVQFKATRTSSWSPGNIDTEFGAGEMMRALPGATAATTSVAATSYVPGVVGATFFAGEVVSGASVFSGWLTRAATACTGLSSFCATGLLSAASPYVQ